MILKFNEPCVPEVVIVGRMMARNPICITLADFTKALESGAAISEKFTVRTFRLNLQPTAYDTVAVRKTRELLNLSQPLFAKFLGVSVQTVRAWEQEDNVLSDMASISTDAKGNRRILFTNLSGKRDTLYVITRYRDATQNLRTTMLKIIKRANLEPWERVFHNLRASRQTELARTFPARVVCDWMGNSVDVAGEHYLHTSDEDFQRATETTRFPTRASAEMGEMAGIVTLARSPETRKPRGFAGFPADSVSCTSSHLPDQGPNSDRNSREIRPFAGQGDAESDAVCTVSDPWLARLIEVWSALANDVQGEILTLAGLRPDDVDDSNEQAAHGSELAIRLLGVEPVEEG